jgi:hypothetical protein
LPFGGGLVGSTLCQLDQAQQRERVCIPRTELDCLAQTVRLPVGPGCERWLLHMAVAYIDNGREHPADLMFGSFQACRVPPPPHQTGKHRAPAEVRARQVSTCQPGSSYIGGVWTSFLREQEAGLNRRTAGPGMRSNPRATPSKAKSLLPGADANSAMACRYPPMSAWHRSLGNRLHKPVAACPNDRTLGQAEPRLLGSCCELRKASRVLCSLIGGHSREKAPLRALAPSLRQKPPGQFSLRGPGPV